MQVQLLSCFAGTVASAATAAFLNSRSFFKPKGFNVNRPFFYAVYNEETMMFTFAGKVGDPTIA